MKLVQLNIWRISGEGSGGEGDSANTSATDNAIIGTEVLDLRDRYGEIRMAVTMVVRVEEKAKVVKAVAEAKDMVPSGW